MASAVLDARLVQGLVPRLRIFRDVAPAQLGSLIKQCWVISAPRGTIIVERGARLPGVFGLAYGAVKLSLRGQDGEERVLHLVPAGQTFGEATSLLGRPSHSGAIALVDSKLVVIPVAAIFALMDRDARFGRAVALLLAEHALELLAEVESAMQRGAQRLASYLGALANSPEGNSDGNGGTVVRLPVSKTLVAARLGVKKETLSRLLRQFAAGGVIEVSRREISILDREALAKLSSSRAHSA
ncbi:MAG TPA: Crp/Fnr family transcriptional regulator [Burkholderiales bacterium]|nr:Crp/Fnr family transcriptional regulator [Burkholderiales bacterium]